MPLPPTQWPTLRFREALPASTRQELESLVAQLLSYLAHEHAPDGSHGDLTGTSLTLSGAGAIGERMQLITPGSSTIPDATNVLRDGEADGPRYTVYRLAPTANATIQTIYAQDSDAIAGQLLILINTSAFTVTLKHHSTGGLGDITTNTGSDYVIAAGCAAALWFDRTTRTFWMIGTGAPAGTGDVTGPASSVDSEIALFSGVTGKLLKRATGTGLVKATSGVYAVGTAAYSNIQDVSATSRILGRKTAGSGAIEECTLSDVLDFIGSAVQGDQLYRGASTWARAGAGAVGQFWQTGGPSANPSWGSPTGGNSPLLNSNHLEYSFDPAAAWKSSRGSSGSATGTTPGTWPATAFTDGPYGELGTSAALNSTAQCTSQTSGGNKELNFAWDFDLTYVVQTDAAAVTTVRYMVGVGVNNENADPVTGNWIGFRFSTGSGDTQWVGVTYDGTQAVTANIAAIAAATKYKLRIRKSGSTVFFSVNGGTETSQTSHVPVNNAYASLGLRVTALAAAARSLFVGRMWVDYGT